MSARMRAVIFHGPRRIRLEEVSRPKTGPGEVLLKVGAALTCGTDFKAYRQGHKVLLGALPSPFGHELAGTVVEVGKGVKAVRIGDRVVAANSAPCDRCYFCGRGQNQLCDNLKLHNGAYAEYNLVPAHIARHNLWKLPDYLVRIAPAQYAQHHGGTTVGPACRRNGVQPRSWSPRVGGEIFRKQPVAAQLLHGTPPCSIGARHQRPHFGRHGRGLGPDQAPPIQRLLRSQGRYKEAWLVN